MHRNAHVDREIGCRTVNTESSAGGSWYPDPTSRFELRYHNGSNWTADVSSNGRRFIDPLGVQPGSGTGGSNALATASLVLGIVGLGLGWLPFVFVLGAIAAVLALTFGIIGRRRAKTTGTGAGFSTAGIVMGAAGLVSCIIGVLITIAVVDALNDYENPAAHDAEIVACEHDGRDHTAEIRLTNVDTVPASYSVRIDFVRRGTDNVQRQANIEVGVVQPEQTVQYRVTRSVELSDVDCVIREVHGPLPFGVDPGL